MLPSFDAFADELEKIAKFDWRAARSSALADLGPALGSIVGSGVAAGYGVNPIAGAAAGYGIGAIPEIVHGLKHRNRGDQTKHAGLVESALSIFRK